MITDLDSTLNTNQREICQSLDNYYIMAAPGSGKTRLLTYRLWYLSGLFENSRKLNIAITYTNRAAEEIENRLNDIGTDMESIWTGTIHQFCMSFIIRPYSLYSNRLKKGYRIIDEYTKDIYGRQIATSLGKIVPYYEDPLNDAEVDKLYCKKIEADKEIDFSKILEYSYQLLLDNPFIAQNIAHIIRSFSIDEFQDTNELQYLIISEIVKANREINVLFVGDVNQAIYGDLGGVAKSKEELETLMNISFCSAALSGCYRSSQRIIEYYTNFEVEKTGAYSLADKIRDIHGTICYDSTVNRSNLIEKISFIIRKQLEAGIDPKDICIIAPRWNLLYDLSKELKAELPDLDFDAPDLSPFKYDPLNPFFLFTRLIYTPAGKRPQVRKRIAGEILSILREEYNIVIGANVDKYDLLESVNSFHNDKLEGIEYYKSCIEFVLTRLGVSFSTETELKKTYDAFIEKTKDRIQRYSIENTNSGIAKCFNDKTGVVISTIHGVKGEEYRTVIAISLLNGYLPHWNIILSKGTARQIEAKKLLYVLCSRAKENLFLFSESGHLTAKGKPYTPTDELSQVNFQYDNFD